jgi:hypothetical protein
MTMLSAVAEINSPLNRREVRKIRIQHLLAA